MSEATAILKDLAGVHNRLLFPQAVALARVGKYAEAEEWLRFVLEREPSADAYCLLGKVYGQQARYADAQGAFERALTLEPNHPEAGPALKCVRKLVRPGSGVSFRTWRLAGVASALMVIVAVATLLRLMPGDVTPPASSATVTRSPNVSEAVHANVVELMQAFAAVTAAMQPLSPLTDVSLQPRVTASTAVVAVQGTVPSEYLRDELTRVLGLRAGVLKIDTTGVEVTGRYTIRKGDTFSSIAAALCGRASLYTALQAQNRDAIPERLRPGSSIAVTCQ